MEQPSGTVTLLFTDIEGSTRLLDELGPEPYREALATHRRVLREAFARHGGYEVDSEGDAFFVVFQDAPAAVRACREAQSALREGSMRVRMGLHTGAPLVTDEGYVGEDVHLGARIAAAGHGGQVLLSKATAGFVGMQVTDLGEHRVKDFAEPVWIYQLGEESFPPLKTISNTNLPRPASSFVGREREVAEVVALIREGARLVTLTGPGGTGKTRLAIEAAAELVPEFGSGVFWIGLATLRDPELVPETIGQVLGVKGELAGHLGDRQMLLLLDNLEQVIDASSTLATLVESCPNLTLLVTSREVLRVRGEVEFDVLPLADQDAVELFSTRAHVPPSEAVEELCRRLDSMPLALELAAARTRALTPEQILDRLGDRLDLFKGGRDAEPRQATLRSTIEWSNDLLSPEEQRSFAGVAVFAGGCTIEAAEEVCDADLDTLQSLVEKSLVRRAGERFWLLETIREFALERLEAGGEADELRNRLASWSAALAERARPELHGADQLVWLDRLDAEHANFRATLRWTLGGADPDLGALLAAALAWFWQLRSYLGEGELWLGEALPAATAPAGRAALLEGRGRIAYYRDQHETAAKMLAEAAALWHGLGDRRRESGALAYLSIAHGDLGDREQTRKASTASVALARELGDAWTLGLALWALGANISLGTCDGTPGEAREALEGSVSLLRGTGDRWALAASLFYLGMLAGDHGETGTALALVGEAADLLRAIGDKWRLAIAVRTLAGLVEDRDPTSAERLRVEAATLEEELGLLRMPA